MAEPMSVHRHPDAVLVMVMSRDWLRMLFNVALLEEGRYGIGKFDCKTERQCPLVEGDWTYKNAKNKNGISVVYYYFVYTK